MFGDGGVSPVAGTAHVGGDAFAFVKDFILGEFKLFFEAIQKK